METELTTPKANTQEETTQEETTQEETTQEETTQKETTPEEEYDEFDDSIFDLIEGRANALASAALLIVPIVIFTTAIPFTAGGSYVILICAGLAFWRATKAGNAYAHWSVGRLPIKIPRKIPRNRVGVGGGDDELVVQRLTPELSEFLEKHAISAREAFTHEKFNPKDMNDPNSDLYKFIYGAMLDKDGNIINKDDIDTLIAEQTKRDILYKLKNPEIQQLLTTKIEQFTHSYVSSIFNVAKIIAAKKLGKGGKTRRRPKRKRSKTKRNQKKSNKRRS